MTLLTDTEARGLLETDLHTAALAVLLDDAALLIEQKYGPLGVDVVERRFVSDLSGHFFLRRQAEALASVKEISGGTPTTLDAASYRLDFGGRAVRRLNASGCPGYWYGSEVEVTYTPKDDTAARKRVQLDLLRLVLTFKGFLKAEGSGDYNWSGSLLTGGYEREREAILCSLVPVGIAA
jgi:hypothetical protein